MKPTPEQRARALRQAEGIMHLLEETLPRIDPSTEEFEQACALYAQGVLIKLRLTPAPSL
jgi:exonuclease VII small subunit